MELSLDEHSSQIRIDSSSHPALSSLPVNQSTGMKLSNALSTSISNIAEDIKQNTCSIFNSLFSNDSGEFKDEIKFDRNEFIRNKLMLKLKERTVELAESANTEISFRNIDSQEYEEKRARTEMNNRINAAPKSNQQTSTQEGSKIQTIQDEPREYDGKVIAPTSILTDFKNHETMPDILKDSNVRACMVMERMKIDQYN